MSDVLTVPVSAQATAVRAGEPAPRSLATAASRTRHPARQGLSPVFLAFALVGIAALLWALWMTKSIADLRTERVPIAAVRLQPLIEEYVQVQARSGAPEQQVIAQTQAFMAVLDAELLRRGRAGTTVLVAEAVLSKNVPDVTAEVRQAVYAKLPTPTAGPSAPEPVPGSASAMMSAPSGLGGGNGQR